MRPGQWVWVWMWLPRLGPLESGEKLGRVGRRKAGDWGQCHDQSRPCPAPPPATAPRGWEATTGLFSLFSTLLSHPPCPA